MSQEQKSRPVDTGLYTQRHQPSSHPYDNSHVALRSFEQTLLSKANRTSQNGQEDLRVIDEGIPLSSATTIAKTHSDPNIPKLNQANLTNFTISKLKLKNSQDHLKMSSGFG